MARAGRILAVALGVCAAGAARAEDMPVFKITLKDGVIEPARLTVPAGRAFRLEIANQGTLPAEFESLSLHKEKVLAAGVTSTLVFRRLEPGDHDFFDDFHPGSRAVLVAQ